MCATSLQLNRDVRLGKAHADFLTTAHCFRPPELKGSDWRSGFDGAAF